jgi:MFS family permease
MSDRIEPYVWKIAGVVILGMTMSILDTTIVNVALDTLSRELHTTLAQIQWVATGYLLALAAVIPLTGWAARRFGAKRVYLASIFLFTVGSALCGVAGSSTSLILFRVLQGVGGGMIMPISQMIMAEVAGPKRTGKLDWLGLLLLATSMPLIVYGLSEIATKESFTAPSVVWPIVGGIALAGYFGWHALHVERPLLDVRLYANRIFAAASLTTFGLGAALFGAMILVPLYYQQVRGEDVIVTGLLVGPQGLGMLLVAPWIARFTDRFGGGRVAFVGISVLTLSSLPLCFIGANTSILFISILLLVRGVGIGLSFIPTTTVAFASLRTDQLSDATPQMNVLQRVGGAIGTAVLAVVLQRASKGASSPSELAGAFGTAYWWALGICAASMIPVLVLLRAEGPKEEGPVSAEVEVAEEFVEPIGA